MDDVPIIQYWHSESIPHYVNDLLRTFRDGNPDMRHLVFSERSAAKLIAEHYGKREVEAFAACAIPAMQADYFRYCAVLALGGTYCDADARCLASLRPVVPATGKGQLFGRPDGPVINGFFAFGSPDHHFLELALKIATANIERRLCNRVYYTTGAPIFETLYLLDRLGSFDALIDRSKGRRREDFIRFYCETIGDYDHVPHAMEGIEVGSIREISALVSHSGVPLPYQETSAHWTNLEQEIFR